MAETFRAYWSADVELLLYAEGFEPDIGGITVRQLPPWFEMWKRRHVGHGDAHGRDRSRNRAHRQVYDFRRDCVRFAHKVAAIIDAAGTESDLLIWIDADTVTHQPVDEHWVRSLVDNSRAYLHWLERPGTYPECGFLIFRPIFPVHRAFMRRMREIYETGEVFGLPQTHDSFVFQIVSAEFRRSGAMPEPFNLSAPTRVRNGHPWAQSRLAERLDHLKGARKQLGRTPKSEAPGRTEQHWR
jgi:hypothetical protein